MQSRITLDTQLKISPLGSKLCLLYSISRKRTPRQIQRLRVQRQKILAPVQQRKCQFRESNLGIPRHLHKLSRRPRKQRKGLLATISWDEGGALKVWVMNPSQGHEWSTSPAEGDISCIVENALVNIACMSLYIKWRARWETTVFGSNSWRVDRGKWLVCVMTERQIFLSLERRKSALERSGLSSRSVCRFLSHEAVRSISTPPLDGILVHPQHFIRLPSKFAPIHLYSWGKRGLVRVKCLAQEHNLMTVSNQDLSTWSWAHY